MLGLVGWLETDFFSLTTLATPATLPPHMLPLHVNLTLQLDLSFQIWHYFICSLHNSGVSSECVACMTKQKRCLSVQNKSCPLCLSVLYSSRETQSASPTPSKTLASFLTILCACKSSSAKQSNHATISSAESAQSVGSYPLTLPLNWSPLWFSHASTTATHSSLAFLLPPFKASSEFKTVLHVSFSKRKKTDHVTPLLQSLHWLPISQRIVHKVNTLCYKSINSSAPVYLSDCLQIYTPARTLRSSSDTLSLCIPRTKLSSAGARSFSVSGPTTWNSLPLSLCQTPTIDSFKRNLKTSFFRSCNSSPLSFLPCFCMFIFSAVCGEGRVYVRAAQGGWD